jgi:hypothetical protein
MKFIYIRIILFLICFHTLNTSEIIKTIKSNLSKKNFLRLLDINLNYDKNTRTDEDLDSIENCENSDNKYFLYYLKVYNLTFDKNLDLDRAVSWNNIIKYFIGSTY